MSDLPSMPRRLTIRVVGVTFVEGYPETLGRLEAVSARAWLNDQRLEAIPALLVRTPDNPHDANAIEVHVPSLGGPIGHLPRNLAARLAPHLDAGETWSAVVSEVVTDPEHPERPGVNVRLELVVRDEAG